MGGSARSRCIGRERAAFLSPNLRMAVTLLSLIAFVFQSYLVQIHIHGLSRAPIVAADNSSTPASSHKPGKKPVDQDRVDCPLCQQGMRAGNFVMPAATLALPVTLAVSTVLIAAHITGIAHPVSHIWRGRAPPTA